MNMDVLLHPDASERSLGDVLGITFESTPAEDECVATMAVNEVTRQPFGFLCGGASLALAETLAGAGSLVLCPGCHPFGISVNANHMKAVPEGQTVRAVGHIVHKGRTLHVWNVDIYNERGVIVSTARVTNFIVHPDD